MTETRRAYAAGALTSLGHLLIQAGAASAAATQARKAARVTDDLSAAEALDEAAAALDGAGMLTYSAMHLLRAIVEDVVRPRQ